MIRAEFWKDNLETRVKNGLEKKVLQMVALMDGATAEQAVEGGSEDSARGPAGKAGAVGPIRSMLHAWGWRGQSTPGPHLHGTGYVFMAMRTKKSTFALLSFSAIFFPS